MPERAGAPLTRFGYPELTELAALVPKLPLPIAQLARRALNSHSPLELHHNVYYLAEASLKLASAARIGLWLEHALDPSSPIAKRLEALAYPSLGQWRDFLRDIDRAIARKPDSAGLPMGSHVGRLQEPREPWSAVLAFAEAAEQAGAVSPEAATTGRSDGLLGFFDLVVSYRNRVIAHGGQRVVSYYEQMSGLLLCALQEALLCDELFGDLRLVYARLKLAPEDGAPSLFWQDLTGIASLPLDPEACATAAAAPARALAGRVCLIGADGVIPLHPLVVYRIDQAGRESIGFLNRTIRRGNDADEVRRVDYLDYDTGENVAGIDTRAALTSLLGRLRGQPATVEDLRAAQDASFAEAEPEPDASVMARGMFVGDFEIGDEIGRGGMGVVYQARQCSLNRRVALKVLPPSLAGDSAMLRRFRNEMSAIARCDHPNVIRILTSGLDSERYFYAMELVQGADLARVCRSLARLRQPQRAERRAALPGSVALREGLLAEAVRAAMAPNEDEGEPKDEHLAEQDRQGKSFFTKIAELFAEAADGLDHLHSRGILHRDIKPSNLLLTADAQRMVIMDLGLARLHDVGTVASRSDVRILGTLRYAAPEQLIRRLDQVDYRADLYSLGASLYEIVTGRPLFDGDTESRLVQQILYETPIPPRKVDRRIPHDLAAILSVATSREASSRYPSANAMACDLRAFAQGRPPPIASAWQRAPVLQLVRRRPVALAIGALIAASSAIGAGGWWKWNRIETVTCEDVVYRWEAPECVGALEAADRAPFAVRYRLGSRRGRVFRLERINGSGSPSADEQGEARWEVAWSESGKVSRVIAHDISGTPKLQWVFSADLGRAERRDPGGNPKADEGSEVSVHRIEHDSRGFRRSVLFNNIYGYPIPDQERRYGLAMTTDDRGRVVEIENLGEDGRPAASRHGIMREVVRRDGAGRVIGRDFVGATGRPPTAREGIAGHRIERDERGNPIGWSWVDGEGNPAVNEDGTAGWRASYDSQGNRVAMRYLSVSRQPTWHRDGYSGWEASYDAMGRMVRQVFLDLEGRPTTTSEEHAGWRRAYDASGRLSAEEHLDEAGAPTSCHDGYFRRTVQYDSIGRRIGESYFDQAGHPVLTRWGFAGWRAEHDLRGNEVLRVFVGVDGNPRVTTYGHAGWRAEHDERGTQVQISYLDEALRTTTTANGYASVRTLYNSRADIIESAFFDPNGRPVATSDGYAIVRRNHDRRGNQVEESYWGIEGKPVLNRRGVFQVRMRHDERGNKIEETYVGLDGAAAVSIEGHAGWRASYDAWGRPIEVTFLGRNGRVAGDSRGVARKVTRYDDRGHAIEEGWFDVDGRPAATSEGSRWTARYDVRGRLVEKTWWSADGSLVRRKVSEDDPMTL